MGHSQVENDPTPRKTGTTPQARVLKSDTIELEIENIGPLANTVIRA